MVYAILVEEMPEKGLSSWTQYLDGKDFLYGTPFAIEPGQERICKFNFYPMPNYKGEIHMRIIVDQGEARNHRLTGSEHASLCRNKGRDSECSLYGGQYPNWQ